MKLYKDNAVTLYCGCSFKGKKPDNIPGRPNRFYKNKGWLGIEDWLGYSRWNFRRFKEARAFVRGLGLNSVKEWYA
jgi:hypothetical protein